MKRSMSYVLLFLVFLLQQSCKDVAESMINCTGESLLTSVHHTVDGSSVKLVHFEAKYSGSHNIESVSWEFGDGNIATGTKVDHTYATTGTYQVKAKVKIRNDKSSCESDPTRSVVIN